MGILVLDESRTLTTRLILRVRASYKPDALRVDVLALLEPVHFLMERGMLQGIKSRAESDDAGNMGPNL